MTRSSSFQAVILTTVAFGALCAGGGSARAQFKQTDLASDVPGLATVTDPNLVNTWGVTAKPGATPFWIDNQGTGTSSLYSVTGSTTIAPVNLNGTAGTNFAAVPGGGPVSGPTGIVANSGTSFSVGGAPAVFIFANLNGTISAWNGSNINPATMNAATVVGGTQGAVYTGLAINPGTSTNPAMLYAANGAGSGSIDVFNSAFNPVTNLPPSAFVDPNLASGYVPFNVDDINGKVYVTYALAGGPPTQDGALGGQGAIAVFDEDGNFLQELVGVMPAGTGELASPWGLAIAPTGFGSFGGDLLVGNFSAALSEVNAFNPTTGAFEGTIAVNPGAGQTPGGLWDLTFGGGGADGDPNTLFISDGIDGETHGLFASIASVPEPSTWAMMLAGLGALGLFAQWRRRGPAIG